MGITKNCKLSTGLARTVRAMLLLLMDLGQSFECESCYEKDPDVKRFSHLILWKKSNFSHKETGFKIETPIILEFYPKSFRQFSAEFTDIFPDKIAAY